MVCVVVVPVFLDVGKKFSVQRDKEHIISSWALVLVKYKALKFHPVLRKDQSLNKPNPVIESITCFIANQLAEEEPQCSDQKGQMSDSAKKF